MRVSTFQCWRALSFSSEVISMSTKLLKVPKVAEIIDATIPRTYELLRQGIIPGIVRMGRQIRVDPDALAEWIARGGETQAQGSIERGDEAMRKI